MNEISQLDIRKIRCLDGLHYSFQILEKHYSDLYNSCCKISSEQSAIIDALAAAWGFIDSLHRIREIVQSVPSLSTKHAEMRAFLNATALAEDYRHYIQHLRNELANNPPNTFPVWGTLSWVDPEKNERSHLAIMGAQIQGTSFSGCVYDTVSNTWVSKVCLGVDSKSFNFDPIFVSCLRMKKFVVPFLVKGAAPEVELHDKIPIITMDVFPTKMELGRD